MSPAQQATGITAPASNDTFHNPSSDLALVLSPYRFDFRLVFFSGFVFQHAIYVPSFSFYFLHRFGTLFVTVATSD